MSAFWQLPAIGRAALLSALLLTLIGLFFWAILLGMRKRRPGGCLPALLLLLLIALDFVCLAAGNSALNTRGVPPPAGAWAGNLPWAAHFLLLLVSDAACAFGLWREWQKAAREITPESIREALDNLPSGLCFSGESGIKYLTNRRMYELSQALSGHLLRNAQELWQELREPVLSPGAERVEGGDAPAFRLANGSVWQFTRSELMLAGERYLQTTAADITKHYALTQELAKSNAALHAQHIRLKKLLAQIARIKREEEILSSKVKLHDQLGRCALASSRALFREHPSEGLAPVFALWRDAVESLERSLGGAEAAHDTQSQLLDAAAALGCAIEFQGPLPEDEEIAYLLFSAVREAVTNAVRHAGAARVTVRLWRAGDAFAAEIADDGAKAPGPVVEGGGLQTLRRRVERAGGTLCVACEAGVRLRLRLPLSKQGGEGEGPDTARQ